MGLHADKVPVSDIVLMAKLLVVAEVLYVFNLVWTKFSLLMMYYRIFRFPYFKRWGLYHRHIHCGLGYLYHFPLHLHLCSCPETLVSQAAW
jgi:hypothetical protein